MEIGTKMRPGIKLKKRESENQQKQKNEK
jgi:hypothetical protein